MPGRPAAIVLTSGALALLDPAQLAAVILHEKAHLAGAHHQLVALTRGLAAAFPCVPLFTRGTGEVTRLTEMRADDQAARASGRPALITALLAMGTGAAIPPLAMGANAGFVAERVQRLLEPRPWFQQAGNTLALIAVTALLTVTFGLLIWLADPVAAQAAALAF
jgi:Zn-dependent protease with chaperone function